MPISSPAPQVPSPEEMIESFRKLADDLERFLSFGSQSVTTNVVISDWIFAKRAVPVLLGTMTGHPHVTDGKAGVTTEVVFWDEQQSLARTMNRWYRLGRPISANNGYDQ